MTFISDIDLFSIFNIFFSPLFASTYFKSEMLLHFLFCLLDDKVPRENITVFVFYCRLKTVLSVLLSTVKCFDNKMNVVKFGLISILVVLFIYQSRRTIMKYQAEKTNLQVNATQATLI